MAPPGHTRAAAWTAQQAGEQIPAARLTRHLRMPSHSLLGGEPRLAATRALSRSRRREAAGSPGAPCSRAALSSPLLRAADRPPGPLQSLNCDGQPTRSVYQYLTCMGPYGYPAAPRVLPQYRMTAKRGSLPPNGGHPATSAAGVGVEPEQRERQPRADPVERLDDGSLPLAPDRSAFGPAGRDISGHRRGSRIARFGS